MLQNEGQFEVIHPEGRLDAACSGERINESLKRKIHRRSANVFWPIRSVAVRTDCGRDVCKSAPIMFYRDMTRNSPTVALTLGLSVADSASLDALTEYLTHYEHLRKCVCERAAETTRSVHPTRIGVCRDPAKIMTNVRRKA